METNDHLPPRPDPKLDRVIGPAAVLVTVLSLLLLPALISACNRLISSG